jgi:ribosomal protein L3
MAIDYRIYNVIPTHCSCCGRALTDPTSIEFGIGPICRGKYGYEDAHDIDDRTAKEVSKTLQDLTVDGLADRTMKAVLDNDSRSAAKALNIALAVWRKAKTHQDDAIVCLKALTQMGYTVLATKVGSKLADVRIEVEGDRLFLDTTYDEGFVDAIRKVKGRKFDGDSKRWSVPKTEKRAAWEAIQAAYPGTLGLGPQGVFTVPAR